MQQGRKNLNFVEILAKDFPQFNFESADDFHWNFETQTIFFEPNSSNFEAQILHEIGHGIDQHANFSLDIELLQMENQAWETAREIAAEYGLKISQNLVEKHLDSYRDWLHRRSLCPNCFVNGFQQSDLSYKCPACGTIWNVNDSRFKSLRRTKK
ncbi:MAG: hypothetical protein Q4A27_02740 [bacterium]|nr:hypothetical protein [bacterium]